MMVKLSCAVTVAVSLAVTSVAAQELSTEEELKVLLEQIEALKQRVVELEQQVVARQKVQGETLEARVEQLEEEVQTAQNPPIRIGGAVRAQYVWADYDQPAKDRGGDFVFDLFRIDFSGEIGDVILSAQYRWFQYMDVVQHAWVGYNFTEQWQGQLGVTKVPFGNHPYNANNYFFSSNFYVGLEDDHDLGAKLLYRGDDWDFDIAFFKNDELGGANSGASSKADRYAYDPVGIRLVGEDLYDAPIQTAAEANSWALRGARKWLFDEQRAAEFGASLQWGKMNDGLTNIGERTAWALHGVYQHDRWTLMGQVSEYDYDLDRLNRGIVVGAYAYYDTIPSKARLYTANVAYQLPVSLGPITDLTFYNDFSLMTNKRYYDKDTLMNVLGVAVAAGGLYTYFDLVIARNQPFIGGSMSGESDDTNTRLNINIGYYF